MVVAEAHAAFGYRPALDGVRAVAVYLVVMFHARGGFATEPLAPHGFIGVDLFFVLSGYIVTSVLLAEHDANGSISLRRFYARRVRRLLPAAVVCVVTTAGAYVLVASLFERLDYVADAQAALLYFANWHFIGESNDYFAQNVRSSPYLHFWSLAIEEQFYVVFPVVLLGLLGLRHRGFRHAITIGLGLVAAASIALQLFWRSDNPVRAYYGTDARVYQLMAGALLAVLIGRRAPSRAQRVGSWLALCGLVGIVAFALWPDGLGVSERGLLATAASLALLAGLEMADSSLTARALSMPTVVFLGSLSYATYLWHWPIVLVTDRLFRLGPGSSTIIVATLATSVAALSQQVLERPFRVNRRLDRHPVPTVAVGLTFSVICALFVIPPLLESPRAPRVVESSVGEVTGTAGSDAPVDAVVADGPDGSGATDDRLPDGIDFKKVRSARAEIPVCAPNQPDGCVTRRGDGPHVVVVGNSVARSFVPAFEELADREGWTLTVNVEAGCGWLRPSSGNGGSRAVDCDARRSPWYRDVLPTIDPDVVILLQGSGGEGDPDSNRALSELFDDEIDVIRSSGARIVVIEAYPTTPEPNPTECLALQRGVARCAFAVEDGAFNPTLGNAARANPHTDLVRLLPLVCPGEEVCPALIDGVPVWRDRNHISDLLVPVIQDELFELLLATGAFDPGGG